MDIKENTYKLIDSLKSTCRAYGLGNDGNEFKVITQVFLYKFINDKFGYEVCKINDSLRSSENWDLAYAEMSREDRNELLELLSPDVPRIYPEQLISVLYNQQGRENFNEIFDSALIDIAENNSNIFVTKSVGNESIPIFEKITNYVTDPKDRDNFAKALVSKLANFSFSEVFSQNYDFFAAIFEYLIQDYNTAGGGKYAEYYTPHTIATIMATLLVGADQNQQSVECYDPSAGTGTLLMALGHAVGESKSTIYAQDISQRSHQMLRLNLILNGMVQSLDNVVQGDTLLAPYHMNDEGTGPRKFDYIVSNPPFNTDFSDSQEDLASMKTRFWAGVPNIPNVDLDSMAIYTLFIQHVVNSLADKGKGAIVVPSGFLKAKSGVANKVRKAIVDNKYIYGVISMPANVFATTATNVSVLFLDKSAAHDDVIMIDASNVGNNQKVNGLQKRVISEDEIKLIIDTFIEHKVVEDFSSVATHKEIKDKKYSLLAANYFPLKNIYVEISEEDFTEKVNQYRAELQDLFNVSNSIQNKIIENFNSLKFNSNFEKEK